MNPTASHWAISSGRNPDGSRSFTNGSFGPFCREDDEGWWRGREEPSLGWAPTVAEAWVRWEKWMEEQITFREQEVVRWKETLAKAREARAGV